jgi:hypothetical protein
LFSDGYMDREQNYEENQVNENSASQDCSYSHKPWLYGECTHRILLVFDLKISFLILH